MRTALKHLKGRSVRRYACLAATAMGAVLLLTGDCGAQSMPPIDNGAQRRIPAPRDPRELDSPAQTPATQVFYEKRLQVLNAAQHRSMVADTDRLLKLISDLNAQINSNNSSTLTQDQLRTVAEIEKLAHSVRDKMRMSVRSATNIDGGPVPPFAQR